MNALSRMNLTTLRRGIRFAKFGWSQGFCYLNPGGKCTVIPPPDQAARARDGMHVQISFWSEPNEPIFEVHAQSLN
jgi:hypothetical protein